MNKLIRWIFGMPLHDRDDYIKFEIKPVLIMSTFGNDIAKMDIESFKKSKVVKQQFKAAKNLFKKEGK